MILNGSEYDEKLKRIAELQDKIYCTAFSIYDNARRKLIDNKKADVSEESKAIIKTKDPKVNYYAARDLGGINIYEHLSVVLNSGIPYVNYLCLKALFNSKIIKGQERVEQVIKHAEVVFNSNDYETILKTIYFLRDKPYYKDYLASKESFLYYEQLYRKDEEEKQKQWEEEARIKAESYSKEQIKKMFSYQAKQSKSVDDLSERILRSNNPEWNYIMMDRYNINREKHMQALVKTNDPYWNNKAAKRMIKDKKIPAELRKKYVIMFAEVVYNSGDAELIKDLHHHICYKPLYQDYAKTQEKKVL